MRSCRVGGMCARDLSPLHRREGPHPIARPWRARHLFSMRSSCLGHMDGMGRVRFPHLHDTLPPEQPEAHTLRKPDLGLVRKGRDVRSAEAWTCGSSGGGVYQRGPGRTCMGGAARAASPGLIFALERAPEMLHGRPTSLAFGHLQLPSPSPCTGRAADLEACEVPSTEKRYGRQQTKRCMRRGKKAIFHILKKA